MLTPSEVVLGAAGGIGQVRNQFPLLNCVSALTTAWQPLSLLLKASPVVDKLSLYDVVDVVIGVTADLSHISSIAVRYTPTILEA